MLQEDMKNKHFNSTMVRLKDASSTSSGTVTAFQFHYGTIKRMYSDSLNFSTYIFQFHYGTIKSSHSKITMALILSISIPLWYD